MSWSVETLFGLTGDAFETERNRIIVEYIKSLPPEKRNVAYATQLSVDLKRETLSPEEFSRWLVQEMNEHLENLSDQLVSLKHIIEGPPVRA